MTVQEPEQIYLGALSAPTRRALARWLCSVGREDLAEKSWWEFNDFCALYFRLRACEDTADLFPRGKWATLQRMQDLIEAAIRGEIFGMRGEAMA